MKILYGITKSNFGGAQRYVFDLALESRKAGHDVTVLCGGNGILIDKLKEEKIRTIHIGEMGRDIYIGEEIESFFKILKILKNEKPEVFHINSSKMGGIGTVAGRLAGVPRIIFTSHGWAFNEPRPRWQKVFIKFLAWLTILFSHKTICVSDKTKEQIASLPYMKNKLVVIHNGISKFNLAKRETTLFTVGTIAELHVIKGLDILLTAWSKFIKHHEAKLIIIGGGEERENLQNMANKLNISDSVIFKGMVDDARLHLNDFDIFVLASRSENLPYVLLEAGLARLPIIATSVGGIPEIIESGANGILIPKEDPEALFSSLVLLAEDADLRKRLGNYLKETVLEEFPIESMVRDTLKAYEI